MNSRLSDRVGELAAVARSVTLAHVLLIVPGLAGSAVSPALYWQFGAGPLFGSPYAACYGYATWPVCGTAPCCTPPCVVDSFSLHPIEQRHYCNISAFYKAYQSMGGYASGVVAQVARCPAHTHPNGSGSCDCDAGFKEADGQCLPAWGPKNFGSRCGADVPGSDPLDNGTNPIHGATGNKYQVGHDYAAAARGAPQFIVHYNGGPGVEGSTFGTNWRHSYARSLTLTANSAVSHRPDGKSHFYRLVNNVWVADADNSSTLAFVADANGFTTGYRLWTQEGEIETYDWRGDLSGIQRIDGSALIITRDSATQRITKIQDRFGRAIQISHNPATGLIASLTDPAGAVSTVTDLDGIRCRDGQAA